MTYEEMTNIGKQIKAEMNQMIENKPDGQYITDYEIYEILSKYGVKYKDWRKIRLAVEEKLKNMPMPRLNYSAGDSVYERSVMLGEGAFLSPNLDLIEKILKDEKRALEKDIDQAVLEFFGSVDTILAMCPQDSRLAKIGARLGYALLAVAALRCVAKCSYDTTRACILTNLMRRCCSHSLSVHSIAEIFVCKDVFTAITAKKKPLRLKGLLFCM